MSVRLMKRRAFLLGSGGLAGAGLIGANWPRLSTVEGYQPLLDLGDSFNKYAQRMALWNRPLAPEFREDQLSLHFPKNGGIGAKYIDPNPEYDQLALDGFRDWRLQVTGLVQRPASFTLDEIRQMPSRTQITMHACDEGWSAIGKWTGVPLGWLLDRLGVMPTARYVVFHALDKIEGENIYDSLDMIDAIHPQTILAHGFNGDTLPVGHGAPLRLRIEMQIGYKNVKHLEKIEVVDSLEHIGNGRGGLFQGSGYQRYAGL